MHILAPDSDQLNKDAGAQKITLCEHRPLTCLSELGQWSEKLHRLSEQFVPMSYHIQQKYVLIKLPVFCSYKFWYPSKGHNLNTKCSPVIIGKYWKWNTYLWTKRCQLTKSNFLLVIQQSQFNTDASIWPTNKLALPTHKIRQLDQWPIQPPQPHPDLVFYLSLCCCTRRMLQQEVLERSVGQQTRQL